MKGLLISTERLAGIKLSGIAKKLGVMEAVVIAMVLGITILICKITNSLPETFPFEGKPLIIVSILLMLTFLMVRKKIIDYALCFGIIGGSCLATGLFFVGADKILLGTFFLLYGFIGIPGSSIRLISLPDVKDRKKKNKIKISSLLAMDTSLIIFLIMYLGLKFF